MGMSASQARLLSITARMSNNEHTSETVSYSKQRLADQTQQITNEYNEALDATKLTVLTGFNGSVANYEDISYNLMTGLNMAQNAKQYVVTDIKGKILVSETIADAYTKSNGNYNQFLANLGYSQADIAVQINSEDEDAKAQTEQQIHEAWDKYFDTVGINKFMPEHDLGFSFTETYAFGTGGETGIDPEYNIGDGYVGFARAEVDEDGNYSYKVDKDGHRIYDPINYEGTTQESKDLYNYAMAITEAYLRVNVEGTSESGTAFKKEFDLDAYKSAVNSDNNSALKYYRNIYDKIQASGYFTYTDTPQKAADDSEHYKYSEEGKGTSKVAKNPLKDNYTFESALRDGTLRLQYYSSTDKAFKSTTISEDNCIQEVRDERAIARAESKYNQDMRDLESKDKKYDLELKKLDTEHKALETEYEAVKNVIQKNVESSFKIFS